MKYHLLLILAFATSISFSQKSDSLLNCIINTDLFSLSNVEKKNEFLHTLFIIDQAIRAKEEFTREKFSSESIEYREVFNEYILTDSILLVKTIKYLELYNHPNKEFSNIACYTPQLIFHHASSYNFENLIELKAKYFPMFYKAYQINALEQGVIWFYLFRFYQEVKKQTYINYELGEEKQIEEMINLLHLKRN